MVLDDILEFQRAVSEFVVGPEFSLISNGSWDLCDKRLEHLHFDHVAISTDGAHQEHVPFETVERTVQYLAAHDIRHTITTTLRNLAELFAVPIPIDAESIIVNRVQHFNAASGIRRSARDLPACQGMKHHPHFAPNVYIPGKGFYPCYSELPFRDKTGAAASRVFGLASESLKHLQTLSLVEQATLCGIETDSPVWSSTCELCVFLNCPSGRSGVNTFLSSCRRAKGHRDSSDGTTGRKTLLGRSGRRNQGGTGRDP